jgi:hypothetical protein
MAQQMITLEEAAEKLGISPEEMKKRLKTDPAFKRLSPIRDGSTVRFKAAAIEELARELGVASEDGLPLAPIADDEPPGSDDFKVPGAADKKKPKKKDDDEPLVFVDTDDDALVLADDSKSSSPKSSGKLVPNKKPKDGSDSDVRLDSGKGKAGKPAPKKPKTDEDSDIPTEEISIDLAGPGSAIIKGGSSAKLSAPKTGGSSGRPAADGKKPGSRPTAPDSSEFELSLDADSDDFELQMNADGSSGGDEVDLGSMPKEKGGSGKASQSGINLSTPADSGIPLGGKKDAKKKEEKKEEKKQDDSDESDVDFEPSLDSSSVPSSTKLGAPKSGKLVLDADSSSEFELTLDDSSNSSLEQAALGSDELDDGGDKGDIFETDFEIPPMPDESASEAVALESDTDLEKSDFELAMDDSDVVSEEPSGSEVVLLEDEAEADAPKSKSKIKKKAAAVDADVDVDLADEPAEDDDGSAAAALKGVKGKPRDDDDDEVVPAGSVIERPTKPWGIVPLLFLAPSVLVVLVGALMSYEALQTQWGYQQPRKPTAPLIHAIASQLKMELRDQ